MIKFEGPLEKQDDTWLPRAGEAIESQTILSESTVPAGHDGANPARWKLLTEDAAYQENMQRLHVEEHRAKQRWLAMIKEVELQSIVAIHNVLPADLLPTDSKIYEKAIHRENRENKERARKDHPKS